ncbi:MAG TPA: radical SAM protein [Nitrospirota bacterium]|nr:radical SAM protein [Nitrospirota bacterium]
MANKCSRKAVRKISFIEASAPGLHIFSRYPIPRLGAVLLSTILQDRGYEVKVFIEGIAEPDWSFVESSDLVCISTITSTAIRAYAIAKRFKTLNIPVIIGGAHPTFVPDEALESSDFVVRGEGEHTLLELIEHLKRGVPALQDIDGISFKDATGKNVHNRPREFIKNLDNLPIPDFSLVHRWSPTTPYPISTSRGCPHDCYFCSVIGMFGKEYRCKSVEATLEELKYAVTVSMSTKFIVDDNFTANKKRAKEILRRMIAQGIKTSWSAQVRTDIAKDPELLRLMADSGCFTLFIGFESINPRTLIAYNKKQTREDIVSCIKAVKDHGIHIHGMFVLGADTDDLKIIRETASFATALRIDTVQFMLLTPLPGTELFRHMIEDNRLIHKDWSKYDSHHVVYRHPIMLPNILQLETFKAMGHFYSWKHIFSYLMKLELQYVAICLYGKFAVRKFLKSSSAYLQSLTGSQNGRRCCGEIDRK